MIPQENIWNGVHGPCPKYIFETTADREPTKNPDSEPKYIADITTIAVTGLNPGTMAKINRPAEDSATIAAIAINSLLLCVLCSNLKKNSKHESKAIAQRYQSVLSVIE